jgi:eukaryotic-like serine/threonine-protein kinase
MTLRSGTQLGPYEIQSQLGAGGMGEVYRARDIRLNRTVAIKILAAHLSSSPELKQRFEREARALSSLNHPNICHLYDIGSQDGTDYLVMEFLEGETLADRVHKGALPLHEIAKIGAEVADALQVHTRPASCIGTSNRETSCSPEPQRSSWTLGWRSQPLLEAPVPGSRLCFRV